MLKELTDEEREVELNSDISLFKIVLILCQPVSVYRIMLQCSSPWVSLFRITTDMILYYTELNRGSSLETVTET